LPGFIGPIPSATLDKDRVQVRTRHILYTPYEENVNREVRKISELLKTWKSRTIAVPAFLHFQYLILLFHPFSAGSPLLTVCFLPAQLGW
jgi:hypothetical protein